MAKYKVLMTYPNGKVEEIDDMFDTLSDAKEYGHRLLDQVGYNASYKDNGRKFVKPYFIVTTRKDGETKIVFESEK